MPEPVRIRRLVVDDAPKLKACFERCYGDSYVAGHFYEPEELRRRIASGRLRSVVAEAAGGEIVGHMGLTLRHPEARTVDAGNTVVDPLFRGHKIVVRLGISLNELCANEGFLGYHHYPTTVHPIMQRLAVADEGTETGVMLAYIPAGTEYRELEGEPLAERPAATVVWRPFAPCPARTVYVPAGYGDIVEAMYARAKLERQFGDAAEEIATGDTEIESRDDLRRGLLHIEVRRPGRDLARTIESAISSSAAEVIHANLPMGDPATPVAADVLRDRRFWFCAVLPEYLNGDVLRLQRLRSGRLPRPNVVNRDAQAIFALIERDQRRRAAQD